MKKKKKLTNYNFRWNFFMQQNDLNQKTDELDELDKKIQIIFDFIKEISKKYPRKINLN